MIKNKSVSARCFCYLFWVSYDLGLLLFHIRYINWPAAVTQKIFIYLFHLMTYDIHSSTHKDVFTRLQFSFSGDKKAFKATLEVKFMLQLNKSHRDVMDCAAQK